MLFRNNKPNVAKPTKNELMKTIKDSGSIDIGVFEPVDKNNIRLVKQELDKLVRNGDVSIVVIKSKS